MLTSSIYIISYIGANLCVFLHELCKKRVYSNLRKKHTNSTRLQTLYVKKYDKIKMLGERVVWTHIKNPFIPN